MWHVYVAWPNTWLKYKLVQILTFENMFITAKLSSLFEFLEHWFQTGVVWHTRVSQGGNRGAYSYFNTWENDQTLKKVIKGAVRYKSLQTHCYRVS